MNALSHFDSAPVAVLPEFPSIGESLAYQGSGLLVVLLALCSIWGALELIGLYFKAADRRTINARQVAATAAIPAEPAKPGQTLGADVIPPEIIAVIAGAVHATLGQGYRVRVVHTAETPVDWAREGRRQIFASHKVR